MQSLSRFMLSLVFAAAALTTVLTIAGCDRYRVTLNERVVSEPPRLLGDIRLADKALATCLAQTVEDQRIRTVADLTTLVCTNAGIASLDGIETLSAIETLNLASNRLTSAAPLLFLGNLTAVNLADNPELSCDEAARLRDHLPDQGTLILPEHCQ